MIWNEPQIVIFVQRSREDLRKKNANEIEYPNNAICMKPSSLKQWCFLAVGNEMVTD